VAVKLVRGGLHRPGMIFRFGEHLRHDQTISRLDVEWRVLKVLRQFLLAPELCEEFARTFQEVGGGRNKEVLGQRAQVESNLKQVECRID
jgi:hypothetical protein